MKKTYHHGDLRNALIESAVAIVGEEGLGGLSLRKVARRAGVSHSAPAHHFGDLSGLLTAIALQGYRQLTDCMRFSEAKADPKDTLGRFQNIGQAYLDYALAQTSYFRIMYSHFSEEAKVDTDLRAASSETMAILEKAILACQKEGLVRPDNVTEQAGFVWSAVHGAALLLIEKQFRRKGIMVEDDFGSSVLRYIYQGLQPRTPPTSST